MNDPETNAPHGCACGCGEAVAKGARFRQGHWARTRPKAMDLDRFWSKVDRRGPDDCWEWIAARDRNGYGQFWDPARRTMGLAHRFSYAQFVAPLPTSERPGSGGVLVRHTCDNPPCVNPAHLIRGGQVQNMAEMKARGRQPNNRRERNPKAKLTAEQVAEIRKTYTGRYGEKMEIARRYGISSGHVSKILAGSVW